MLKTALIALTLTSVATPGLATPNLAQYKFTTVDYPGAIGTVVYAVNDWGQYVGARYDASGSPHAIWFDGHQLTSLDPQGVIGKSSSSQAYSINNLEQVAGSYADAKGVLHGFIYRAGRVTTVDHPSGLPTEAYGINDLDQVIGVYHDGATVHAFVRVGQAFVSLDQAGGVTYPFSINDRGEIVGEVEPDPSLLGHGFTRQPDGKVTLYDAPGGPDNTFLISINNLNQNLGAYYDADGNYQNFLLVEGTLVPFNVPASFGATFVSAQTINDQGAIVGYFVDANGVNHGFVATAKDAAL